jgi:hypothetical protein
MGIFDKLFGGTSDAPGAVPLRAYGKIRLYAEYRRLEVAPGTPTLYSQWLDAGRLAWVKSPTKTATGVTRATRLLLQLPGAKETVIASLWDSGDNLGRVFPFSFFATVPTDTLAGGPLDVWLAAAALQPQFDAAFAEIHQLAGGGDFYRRFQKRGVDIRPRNGGEAANELRTKAAAADFESFFRRTMGESGPQPGLWLASIKRRLSRWRENPASTGALTLPISSGPSQAEDVALWLAALPATRVGGLSLLWHVSGTDARLCVLNRAATAEDFQLLSTDADRYGNAEHLANLIPTAADAPLAPLPVPSGPFSAWLANVAS